MILVIGIVIIWGAFRVIKDSLDVLLEFAPSHVEAEEIRQALLKIDGVVEVHDIHMWTISSGVYSISAHVVVEDRLISACGCIVSECEEILQNKFKFSHVTIQLEATACKIDACYFKNNGKQS